MLDPYFTGKDDESEESRADRQTVADKLEEQQRAWKVGHFYIPRCV